MTGIVKAMKIKRIQMKLPLSIYIMLIKIYGFILRKPVIGYEDIARLNRYKYIDPSPAVTDLQLKLTLPEEGIIKTV